MSLTTKPLQLPEFRVRSNPVQQDASTSRITFSGNNAKPSAKLSLNISAFNGNKTIFGGKSNCTK